MHADTAFANQRKSTITKVVLATGVLPSLFTASNTRELTLYTNCSVPMLLKKTLIKLTKSQNLRDVLFSNTNGICSYNLNYYETIKANYGF